MDCTICANEVSRKEAFSASAVRVFPVPPALISDSTRREAFGTPEEQSAFHIFATLAMMKALYFNAVLGIDAGGRSRTGMDAVRDRMKPHM